MGPGRLDRTQDRIKRVAGLVVDGVGEDGVANLDVQAVVTRGVGLDSGQDSFAGGAHGSGLFLALVGFVLAAVGISLGDEFRIGFDGNASFAGARVHGEDGDVGIQQSRRAFEEHLRDGNAVEHHRAAGFRRRVGRAEVLPVAFGTRFPVLGENLFELFSGPSTRQPFDGAFPVRGAAKVFEQSAGLAEGEIEAGAPGAFVVEEGFEFGEGGP